MVGRTASGKSTLAVLLARLWDPSTGIIHLDGRDLESFARSELAREVAFVSQETFLFDDTVRGNITLGLTIPDDEVREAARLAGADGFISQLPAGYDTRIGAGHLAVRRPAATAGAGACPGAASPPPHPRRRHLGGGPLGRGRDPARAASRRAAVHCHRGGLPALEHRAGRR